MSQSRSVPPRNYKVLEVVENHVLGPDGMPLTHHTRRRIQALGERVTSMAYSFDTNAVQIAMISGGTASPIRDHGNGVFGVDIALETPLLPGKEGIVEYKTFLPYETAPPPILRRAAGSSAISLVNMSVTFDPGMQPYRVWRAEWAGYEDDAPIVSGSETQLTPTPVDGDPAAGTSVSGEWRELQVGSMVGFQWEWVAPKL
jgi:hypothetical protein